MEQKMSFQTWRAIGIQMGWIRTRDPVSQPMPREQAATMDARRQSRLATQLNREESFKRKLMGN